MHYFIAYTPLVVGKFYNGSTNQQLATLLNLNQKVETLLSYQKDELSYHKSSSFRMDSFKVFNYTYTTNRYS